MSEQAGNNGGSSNETPSKPKPKLNTGEGQDDSPSSKLPTGETHDRTNSPTGEGSDRSPMGETFAKSTMGETSDTPPTGDPSSAQRSRPPMGDHSPTQMPTGKPDPNPPEHKDEYDSESHTTSDPDTEGSECKRLLNVATAPNPGETSTDVMDSGATVTIGGKRGMFTDLHPCNVNVTCANGQVMKCSLMGTIVITSNGKAISIENSLFIPECLTLISISQLTRIWPCSHQVCETDPPTAQTRSIAMLL